MAVAEVLHVYAVRPFSGRYAGTAVRKPREADRSSFDLESWFALRRLRPTREDSNP
jgi:hypothetical protein